MLHVFSEFRWPSTLVTDGGSNMSKAVKTENLVCFQERERERESNKRFLVTQRKLKLKTLGD